MTSVCSYPNRLTVEGKTKLECLKKVIKKEKIGYECVSQIRKHQDELSYNKYVRNSRRKPRYFQDDLYICVMERVNV